MTGQLALRAAFQAIDAAIPADAADAQLLIATKCKALMVGYEARWSGQEWRPLALEQVVVLPIVNPETGRISRTWRHAGKSDGIVTGYGKTALIEHKSTSEEIADPSAVYWRRLAIDGQVSQYVLQAWQSGVRLDATLYDVIRKPAIRPKRVAAAERMQVSLTRRYYGEEVSDGAVEALLRDEAEDFELYGLRLANDVLADPNRYYQRRTVPRLDSDIAEYAGELWEIGQEIRRAERDGLHFRNPASCVAYGSPCEYLGICSGVETFELNDRWERREAVHEELGNGIDGDHRGVLTHSRIKCFQACRRKHFYRYTEGIRRRDDDEREALYFGRVLHLALEAWWREQSTAASEPQEGEQHVEHGNGCAANEAAQRATA